MNSEPPSTRVNRHRDSLAAFKAVKVKERPQPTQLTFAAQPVRKPDADIPMAMPQTTASHSAMSKSPAQSHATPTSPGYTATSPSYAPTSPSYSTSQFYAPHSPSPPYQRPRTPERNNNSAYSGPVSPPTSPSHEPYHTPSHPSPSRHPAPEMTFAQNNSNAPRPPPTFQLPVTDYSTVAIDEADIPCYGDYQHPEPEASLATLLDPANKNQHVFVKKSVNAIRRRITALMQGTHLTTTPITESPFPAHFNPVALDRKRIRALQWERLFFFEKTHGELHLLFFSKKYSPVLVNRKFEMEPLLDPALGNFCDVCKFEYCLLIGEVVRGEGVTPRVMMVFDMMTGRTGQSLSDKPFHVRFAALEAVMKLYSKAPHVASKDVLLVQKR